MPDLDIYEKICSGRFTSIENRQTTMAADVTAIREKIFNGHSSAITPIQEDIKRMREISEQRKRSKSLFIRDIILTLLGGGGIISMILTQVLR